MNAPRHLPRRFGKYEVIRLLGEGGMGIVYEGFDPQIRRQVALKAIKSAAQPEDQDLLERFLREAQAAGRLLHPRIVTVYEYSEDVTAGTDGREKRTPFIAMEFVQGQDLKRLLAAKNNQGERLPLAQVQRIMSGLLDALAYLHANRVVHRDIKPANIIVLADGNIKVTDFGVARLLERRETASFTQHGAVVGTLSYVAPEQFRGEPVDGRTDVYAAGVVLYELLTGRLPFTGTNEELMYKVVNEKPELPSRLFTGVPQAYDAVIELALAKWPSERFQSAADFLRALPPLEAAALPPDVMALVQHELSELKLAGILRLHALLDSGSAPIVLAARQALERLQNDPSPAVAGAAIHVLLRSRGREPGLEPDPPAMQTRHPEPPQLVSPARLRHWKTRAAMLAGGVGVLGVVGATLFMQFMHADHRLADTVSQARSASSRPSSATNFSNGQSSPVTAVTVAQPPQVAADGQTSDHVQAMTGTSEPPSSDAGSSSTPDMTPAHALQSVHGSAPIQTKHGQKGEHLPHTSSQVLTASNRSRSTQAPSSSAPAVTATNAAMSAPAPVRPSEPTDAETGPPAPNRSPQSLNASSQPLAGDQRSSAPLAATNHTPGTAAPTASQPKDAQSREQPPAAKVFHEPDMVHVPAGSFVMGSPANETWRSFDEGPLHTVQVAAFSMGKYAVTFDEWDVCVAEGGCMPIDEFSVERRPVDSALIPGAINPGRIASAGGEGDRGRRPVTNVSWEDAQLYVSWLSHKTGKRYRLPTEAEWEYAARAGTKTAYYWDAIGSKKANCRDCGSPWGGRHTAPVGSFDPNPWGLYDMAGNVFQFTQDCYHESYEDAPADGSAWELGCSAGRVARGGAWNSDVHKLRSAYRIWLFPRGPRGRSRGVGFRLARSD